MTTTDIRRSAIKKISKRFNLTEETMLRVIELLKLENRIDENDCFSKRLIIEIKELLDSIFNYRIIMDLFKWNKKSLSRYIDHELDLRLFLTKHDKSLPSEKERYEFHELAKMRNEYFKSFELKDAVAMS